MTCSEELAALVLDNSALKILTNVLKEPNQLTELCTDLPRCLKLCIMFVYYDTDMFTSALKEISEPNIRSVSIK